MLIFSVSNFIPKSHICRNVKYCRHPKASVNWTKNMQSCVMKIGHLELVITFDINLN